MERRFAKDNNLTQDQIHKQMFDTNTGRLLVQEAAIKNNSNILRCRDGSEYTFKKEINLKSSENTNSALQTGEYQENAPEIMGSSYTDFMFRRKKILDEVEEEKRALNGQSFEEKLRE